MNNNITEEDVDKMKDDYSKYNSKNILVEEQFALIEKAIANKYSIEKAKKEIKWITKNGNARYVKEMSIKHLLKTRSLLNQKIAFTHNKLPNIRWKYYIKIFNHELNKRYEKTKNPEIIIESL